MQLRAYDPSTDDMAFLLLCREVLEVAPQSYPNTSDASILMTPHNPLNYYRTAVDDEGKIIGFIGLERINTVDQTAEPIIMVAPEHRGTGKALEVAELFRDFCVNKLNIRRVTAIVLDGGPSIHLLKAIGFEQEGRMRAYRYHDGKYRDVLVYGWLRQEE